MPHVHVTAHLALILESLTQLSLTAFSPQICIHLQAAMKQCSLTCGNKITTISDPNKLPYTTGLIHAVLADKCIIYLTRPNN